MHHTGIDMYILRAFLLSLLIVLSITQVLEGAVYICRAMALFFLLYIAPIEHQCINYITPC